MVRFNMLQHAPGGRQPQHAAGQNPCVLPLHAHVEVLASPAVPHWLQFFKAQLRTRMWAWGRLAARGMHRQVQWHLPVRFKLFSAKTFFSVIDQCLPIGTYSMPTRPQSGNHPPNIGTTPHVHVLPRAPQLYLACTNIDIILINDGTALAYPQRAARPLKRSQPVGSPRNCLQALELEPLRESPATHQLPRGTLTSGSKYAPRARHLSFSPARRSFQSRPLVHGRGGGGRVMCYVLRRYLPLQSL